MPIRLPPALQRFAEGLILESEKEVMEFVRGYLMKKLEKLTVPLFVDSVTNKTPLLISEEDKVKFTRTMRRVLKNPVARKVWDREKAKLNEKTMVAWWKEDRPDLYGVVINWPNQEEVFRYVHDEIERVKNDLNLDSA